MIHEIYPECWIIKAGIFDEEQIKDDLDEWIYFFKTGRVKDDFSAPGLSEAIYRLDKMQLSSEERRQYDEYVARLRKLASRFDTEKEDIKDALKEAEVKGKIEGKIETAQNLKQLGVPTEIIQQATGLSADELENL